MLFINNVQTVQTISKKKSNEKVFVQIVSLGSVCNIFLIKTNRKKINQVESNE